MVMADSQSKMSKIGSALLLVGAAVTLFLAESAYWVNHTVFNKANFTNTVTTVVTTESNRDAIASAVVDRVFEDRPLAQRFLGDRATSLVSGLLGSDLSDQALTALTKKTYEYVTTSNRKDIAIDLTTIKTYLASIIAIAQTQGMGEKLENIQAAIPDKIVLVESKAVPDLSGTVKTMLWLGPLFWLGTIVMFASYIYIGRARYAKRVYAVGGTITAVAVLGLLAIPFIPPPLAAAIPNIELRSVAESLATAFLAPFKSQMAYLLVMTLVVLAVFALRFKIYHGLQFLMVKLGTLARKYEPQSTAQKTAKTAVATKEDAPKVQKSETTKPKKETTTASKAKR